MPAELDRVSGSTDVALGFLDRLERFAATDVSTSVAILRANLLGWLRAEQGDQPSMALVHQLAARALSVADGAVGRRAAIADMRAELAASSEAERRDLGASRQAVAKTAAALLNQRSGWIATLSHSRAVIDALTEAHIMRLSPRALVAESRPRLEGRTLAAELAAVGLPVWLVADAAMPFLISQAAQVWIGADAVTDRGVLNKIGSYAMALAAREHSVPVYAVAGRRKFLPANTGALKIAEMPPEEVWSDPAKGVQPRNVYFELVPLELIRGVVVEDAVLGPSEAAQLARERELPEELKSS
jgi:translation initiation factor 2B subunit (eIF-2B alpha/beta/delta family)